MLCAPKCDIQHGEDVRIGHYPCFQVIASDKDGRAQG